MITKEKLKRNFTRLRRKFTVFYLRLFKSFGQDKRLKRPKKLTEAENTASEIFLTILHNKDSKLHYDIQTQECYISSSDRTLFVFLEAGNVKIINSVFGYDVHIRQDLEAYLLEKFIREMGIRRNAFKKEVLSKINHSLDSTLTRIKDWDLKSKNKK
jgi:hypothetical protein